MGRIGEPNFVSWIQCCIQIFPCCTSHVNRQFAFRSMTVRLAPSSRWWSHWARDDEGTSLTQVVYRPCFRCVTVRSIHGHRKMIHKELGFSHTCKCLRVVVHRHPPGATDASTVFVKPLTGRPAIYGGKKRCGPSFRGCPDVSSMCLQPMKLSDTRSSTAEGLCLPHHGTGRYSDPPMSSVKNRNFITNTDSCTNIGDAAICSAEARFKAWVSFLSCRAGGPGHRDGDLCK